MTKFETISSVLTAKSPEPKRSSRSEEQLVLVQDSVTVSQKINLPQLDIPTTSLHRILRRIISIFVNILKIRICCAVENRSMTQYSVQPSELLPLDLFVS